MVKAGIDAAARSGGPVFDHVREIGRYPAPVEGVRAITRADDHGVIKSVGVLRRHHVGPMEKASIIRNTRRIHAVPANRGKQRQPPRRRIRPVNVGPPDIAAGIADDDAVGEAVAIRVCHGQCRGDAVNKLRMLEDTRTAAA